MCPERVLDRLFAPVCVCGVLASSCSKPQHTHHACHKAARISHPPTSLLSPPSPPQNNPTGYAYISNVAVSPCAQRRGVARRLMAEAEALAGAWGCSKAGLHVNLANTPAVGLYRWWCVWGGEAPDAAFVCVTEG